MHLLIFSVSRALMALLIALGSLLPSVATAAVFLGICIVSFVL